MTVLMLLLPILVAALITVAVHVRSSRSQANAGFPTQGDAVLTHQSYADAGGNRPHLGMWHHSKAYDAAQQMEAKARDWIPIESTTNSILHGHRFRLCGRHCGLSPTT